MQRPPEVLIYRVLLGFDLLPNKKTETRPKNMQAYIKRPPKALFYRLLLISIGFLLIFEQEKEKKT